MIRIEVTPQELTDIINALEFHVGFGTWVSPDVEKRGYVTADADRVKALGEKLVRIADNRHSEQVA